MRRIIPIFLLISVILCAGCATVDPMTHSQWKREMKVKSEMEKRGIEYKSPAQLRKERDEMVKAAENVKFD